MMRLHESVEGAGARLIALTTWVVAFEGEPPATTVGPPGKLLFLVPVRTAYILGAVEITRCRDVPVLATGRIDYYRGYGPSGVLWQIRASELCIAGGAGGHVTAGMVFVLLSVRVTSEQDAPTPPVPASDDESHVDSHDDDLAEACLCDCSDCTDWPDDTAP